MWPALFFITLSSCRGTSHYSRNDPAALRACVSHDVKVANQWYQENGMLVNKSKHPGLVLGDTDFSFFLTSSGNVRDLWNGNR